MKKLALSLSTTFMPILISLSHIATASNSGGDILKDLSSTEGPELPPSNIITDVIWVFIALGIVIALLVLALKWLSKRNKLLGNQRGMRSLGGISLGQQASIQVVELGGRIYIVGVGNQVTLIDKEDDPEKVAELLKEFELKDQLNIGFSSIRDWMTAKRAAKVEMEQQSDTEQGMWQQSSSFEDLLQSKLAKQTERKQQLEALLKDKNK